MSIYARSKISEVNYDQSARVDTNAVLLLVDITVHIHMKFFDIYLCSSGYPQYCTQYHMSRVTSSVNLISESGDADLFPE